MPSSTPHTCASQILDPYTFPSAHTRLLEPYNYYAFGQRYVGTLINFNDSFLGHAELWDKVGACVCRAGVWLLLGVWAALSWSLATGPPRLGLATTLPPPVAQTNTHTGSRADRGR